MIKTTVLSTVVFLLIASSISISQIDTKKDDYQKKKEHILQVADRIWQTIGTTVPRPKIEVLNINLDPRNFKSFPYYDVDSGKVYFSTGFYDLCMAFGEAALASVLAHELAHYYHKHRQFYTIADVYLSEQENKFIKELGYKFEDSTLQRHEAQADLFAAHRCYLAGYDVSEVFGKILDTTYKILKKSPKASEYYIPLEKRKEIALQKYKLIKSLIPLFNVSFYLHLLGEYELSAICFDYIKDKEYDSWEIILNAGINYALATLPYSNKKFIYPLQIKSNSILSENNYPLISKKGRGYSQEEQQKISFLNTIAENRLNEALRKSVDTSLISIYLACLYDINGQSNKAIPLIKNIDESKLDNYTKLLFRLASGIVYSSEPSIAHKEFNKAAELLYEIIGDSSLVAYNRGLLGGKIVVPSATYEKTSLNLGNEKINGKDIFDWKEFKGKTEHNYPSLKVGLIETPSILVHSLENNYCKFYSIEISDKSFCFAETRQNYTDTTQRGIKIGSTLDELIQKYGNPSRLAIQEDGIYYFYSLPKIIFKIKDNTVVCWIIYGVF